MPNDIAHTVLAFDFGMKRIGIAVGQSVTQTAQALIALKATDGVPDWNAVQTLLDEWSVGQCVVGLPLNTEGNDQEITHAARKFARKLEGRFNIRAHLIDERYTTKLARQRLRDRGINPERHSDVDSIAAELILEAWWSEGNG